MLKAGGAHLPLDPRQPAERLAWLLADGQPAAVVSDSHTVHLLAEDAGLRVLSQ